LRYFFYISVLLFFVSAVCGNSSSLWGQSAPSDSKQLHLYSHPAQTVKKSTGVKNRSTTTLFCISVINDFDEHIKASCRMDRKNVTDFFQKGANSIGIKYVQINIDGENFKVTNLLTTIKKLPVRKNDIVVLAYSGHGFSYTNDAIHPFAEMALFHNEKTKAEYRANAINLEQIFNKIRAKGGRLNLVFGDCCNSYINIPRYEDTTLRVMAPGPYEQQKQNMLTMLMKAKGSYLVGATKKGQMAAGHQSLGGYFTYNLTKVLVKFSTTDQSLNAATVWMDIIKETAKKTKDQTLREICPGNIPCNQDVIYKTVQ
jgi:hypothetical protein